MACGGNDCDDTDAERYLGNPEICDDANRDRRPSVSAISTEMAVRISAAATRTETT